MTKRPISDRLPDRLVSGQVYQVGEMRYYPGEYHKNDLWLQNFAKEGTAIPKPAFDKAMDELFKRFF